MRVHHIGYYVNDLKSAMEKFAFLGYEKTSGPTEDSDRGVSICFMRNGHETVELIAKLGENSMVESLAEKGMSTPYHICYEAEDMDRALKELKEAGFYLTRPPAPAAACGGKRVAFLFQKATGLIEIVEK
ncbi:MAG: VOC family protein [Christensenellaceae bacterium]|jgi:methylmalonyl-CoA/ethylmalonyl-CoA epimerase